MAKTSKSRPQPKKKNTSTPSRPTPKPTAKKAAPKKVAPKKPLVKKTVVKKPAAKKTLLKKNVTKKPVAKKSVIKPTSKKSPLKKAAPKAAAKLPVKKVAAKATAQKVAVKKVAPKAPPKKTVPKKSVAKAPAKKVVRTVARSIPTPKISTKAAPAVSPSVPKGRAFRKEELASFRAMLQKHLELIQGNINALAGDNIKRSPLDSTGEISSHSTHMADHGTDNFDRELALSLASSRQDSVYAIEDAIRRIDEGDYGTCQTCEKPIERPRLKALPFAKTCVVCQSAAERGRSRFQPFKTNYNAQGMASDESPDMSDS